MTAEIGPPEEHVARGDVQPLLSWLRQHVHPIGRVVNAEDLVEQVSGEPLSSAPFLRYLEGKLNTLAGRGRLCKHDYVSLWSHYCVMTVLLPALKGARRRSPVGSRRC